MLTSTIRTGSVLSREEKRDIITAMFATQESSERDMVRKTLVRKYGISDGTITSLVAHETMRRNRRGLGVPLDSPSGNMDIPLSLSETIRDNSTQVIQETTQAGAYAIASLARISEVMRRRITEEFYDIIQANTETLRYDFYQDIEAISDYYDIDPNILEQFLRNRYSWLGTKLDELKHGRMLSEEDKMNIRLYVSEGIDEKDKKKRRKEMAQRYGVSTYVIGAITAWKVDEGGGVVLKKDGPGDINQLAFSGSIERANEVPQGVETDKQLGEAPGDDILPKTFLVGETTSLQARRILDEGIPETPTESIDEGEGILSDDDILFIQELACEFDLTDDEERALFLQDVFDLFPDITIDYIKELISNFPDDSIHTNIKRSGEGMGALINYNNEIKNKWRQKLKEFIDENTDKEKRENMKVLCLPGVECLEIPLYLELGFRPENIIGVEAGIVKGKKDLEVIARFQANAAKYGIQTRIGKLEKVLETENVAFDVVSLDFLGPINRSAMSIVKSIRSREGRTIVLTNFQAKRENSLRDEMIGVSGLRQKNGRYILKGANREHSLINPQELAKNSGKSLKDSRSDASVAQLIRGTRALSSMSPKESNIAKEIGEIFNSELNARYISLDSHLLGEKGLIRYMIAVLSGTLDRVLDDNANLFYRGELEVFKTNLHVFIRNLLFHHHSEDILQHAMYEYNATGTAMITDCLVLDYGNDSELYSVRHLVQFILNLAKLFTEKTVSALEKGEESAEYRELNQYHFRVFDKNRQIKQGYRSSNDELTLQFNGKTLAAITLGKLFGSLDAYIIYKNGRNNYARERIKLS